MMYDKLAALLFPNIDKDISYYEEIYPERDVKFVTRFAPSPTGFLHIGSLYTAYISSIMAKQNNGIMLLRIEDTDSKREVADGKKNIVSDLKNFNINIDEGISNGNYGPYVQSERKIIYQTFVKYLVSIGLAYPCFLTENEISDIRKQQEINKEQQGIYGKYAYSRGLSFDEIKNKIESGISYVIRLKNDFAPGKIICEDLIKGKIEFPTNELDIVLLKSDGIPTYHLAHVIDDHLMRVTHVIRGDEWLSSLPIHYQLFKIFGFKIPKYAHISPITKKEGNTIRKLSKRKDKECLVSYYEELGIPSEVIKLYFNTLINPNYEEWYNSNSTNEFLFSFKKMPIGGSLFDSDKLFSISRIYFSRLTASELFDRASNYYKVHDLDFYNELVSDYDYSINMLNIERNIKKPRKDISCYSDIKKYFWYFFDKYFNSMNSCKQYNNYDISLLKEYVNFYKHSDDKDTWYSRLKSFSFDRGYSPSVKEYNSNPNLYKGHIGNVCEMLRVALTSSLETPDIYEIMQVMGENRVLDRINSFVNK